MARGGLVTRSRQSRCCYRTQRISPYPADPDGSGSNGDQNTKPVQEEVEGIQRVRDLHEDCRAIQASQGDYRLDRPEVKKL